MLPTINPESLAKGVRPFATFNYTPVVVLGVFLLVTIWWLASARKWFKGPIIQGSEAELAAIERSVGETHVIEGAAGGKELSPPDALLIKKRRRAFLCVFPFFFLPWSYYQRRIC